MATRRFNARTVIARPPADVFAWVADHRNVPSVLEGVDRWEPLGDRTGGVGARFDVSMRALGLSLDIVLVLDRWDEPRAIGWRSESGLIAQSGGWRFEACPEGTAVTLTIGYEPPGGALGGLVAGRMDRLVRDRLAEALERMRAALERRTV
jgi:uncharacterized membrane protein